MKILVVCTTDSMVWNFLVPHIRFWEENGNQVEIACSRTGFYFDELEKQGLILHEIPFKRNPFHMNNIRSYRILKKFVMEEQYSVILSQEPVGGVIGRLVGKKCEIKNIYTAHGFHFYKGGPLKYWLLFYPVEKFLAKYTDVLITINNEDYQRSQNFKAKKVAKLNGIGVNLNKFKPITFESRAAVRKKMGFNENDFVVLTVAELIPRKNYETALRSVKKSKIKNLIYLICGDGKLENELRSLASDLGIESRIHFLGFRKDVSEIYHAADVFLFTSYQEGLSIALIEAMASGLPAVCSNIRGNNDLIVNGKGGLLYKPDDVEGFSEGLKYCFNTDTSPFSSFNLERVKKYSSDISVCDFYNIVKSCQ